jgi:hypothetical protein
MNDNQQILYSYAVNVVLPTLRSGGLWVAPDPAPLTVEEITEAFERILDHPSYNDQTIVIDSKDGVTVMIEFGYIRDHFVRSPRKGKENGNTN